MDYGVHLPLISLKGQRHWSLRGLLEYAEIAKRLGFRAISAKDHLIFPARGSMDRRYWPRYLSVRDRWL